MLTWGRGSVLFESSNPLDAMSVSEPITDIKHQWVSVGIINISVTWVFSVPLSCSNMYPVISQERIISIHLCNKSNPIFSFITWA